MWLPYAGFGWVHSVQSSKLSFVDTTQRKDSPSKVICRAADFSLSATSPRHHFSAHKLAAVWLA